ncbi:MAG: hypothetical protein EXQ86_08135 [Rhodospirillales bacterium]|nr:hypothetical protein [Rhodospirillales bacterium]
MRFPKKKWLLLLAVLAAGCAPTDAALTPLYHRAGIPSTFAYAGGRDFKVAVIGNPFPSVAQETFGKTVTDSMQGRHWGPPVNFTTTPGDNARPNYRIVMFFDPPVNSSGNQLCGDAARLVPERHPDRITLHAGFCVADELQSEVKARMGTVSAPENSAFRSMVGAVVQTLVPPVDPHRERRFGFPLCRFPHCS